MGFAIVGTIIIMYSLQIFFVCSEYLYPSRQQNIAPMNRNIQLDRFIYQVDLAREVHCQDEDKVNWKKEGF